jgi:hypothetical protein
MWYIRAGGGHVCYPFDDLNVKRGIQFMTTEQTKDAKVFVWVAAALMVILLFYGLLTILGVVR